MAEKKYGHFDDANREYVITDPKTPWPWINYLADVTSTSRKAIPSGILVGNLVKPHSTATSAAMV